MRIIDLTGMKFGSLLVVSIGNYGSGRHKKWKCVCKCGETTEVRGTSLTQGVTQSCGCRLVEAGRDTLIKRGLAARERTGVSMLPGNSLRPLYSVWRGILDRCNNPKSKNFPLYGGRGIKVSDSWLTFENFEQDMGFIHPKNVSLDRIDNTKGYSKENCRWATPQQQANNTRRNRRITLKGKTLSLAEWSRDLKIPYKRLYHQVVTKGIPLESCI